MEESSNTHGIYENLRGNNKLEKIDKLNVEKQWNYKKYQNENSYIKYIDDDRLCCTLHYVMLWVISYESDRMKEKEENGSEQIIVEWGGWFHGDAKTKVGMVGTLKIKRAD